MDEIVAEYRGGGRLDMHIRGDKVTGEQSVSEGGGDAAPKATGSCSSDADHR